jgi:stage II sporulation protein AA (anti-sigma F factor antagonist)
MATATRLIEVERRGATLVLTPQQDLRELDYREIEAEGEELLRLADAPAVKNVVVDFSRTDYFGSTALGLLARLWKRVRARGGRLALCNVSAHESEIMEVAGLTSFWPIYPSQEDALAAVAA